MKKNSTLLVVLFLLTFSHAGFCTVPQQSGAESPGGKSLLGNAVWITDRLTVPESDSAFYLDDPAPLLRTGFKIRKDVAKAEMWITAAGYYETWLNGSRVGDRQLDPAWTDFSKRVYVSQMDVTQLIRKGKNSWGIMLGNGFYNPLPLRMWGSRNLRNDIPVGRPSAIARLVLTYSDGQREEVCTSTQWVTRPGPVIRNSVYLGEFYDARKEVVNWNLPGSPNKGWKPVMVTPGPGGRLELAEFPPIRITKWVEPVKVTPKDRNRQIIDFGQNFAGFIRVRIQAQAGDTIRFRYGELLYPDGSVNPMTTVCGQIKRAGTGGPGAPAVAEQLDFYVSGGTGEEYFQPRFTFHGFRYVEITGLKELLNLNGIRGARISSDVETASSIQSSSEFLNKLNSNCQWTFLSNLQSVQSDCPAREKFGYGGDINATAEAYIYNFDMDRIYRKIILDWTDAMKADKFVDTAPFVGIEYCGLSWESAFLFLQDALWIHYGDSRLVEEMYPADVAWMEKVGRIHPELVVDNGLSDHESLAKVPVELTGTCHYYQAARIMARFARVAGDKQGIVRYSHLAEKIRSRIIDLFWETPQIEVPNQQTLLATLLACGVLEPADQALALDRLIRSLEQSDYHVTTGIFGTYYLLEALSSQGRTDIAFKIVNQRGFPGWRYMIDNGATTLWETWKESDNTFSQNHPMFGSVSGWYHKWLGGIQPDTEVPGEHSVVLKPRPVAGIDSLTAEKYFPSGTLVSRWQWKEGAIRFAFVIPAGVHAVWMPDIEPDRIRVLESPQGWDSQRSRIEKGFNLASPGSFVFEIPVNN